jgi:hypothetical protein
MWLENINNNIYNLTQLTKPENKGDVNKYCKEIRDNLILKTISEFKRGVSLLKKQYSKKIKKTFKEVTAEKQIEDYDKIIEDCKEIIDKNSAELLFLFRIEIRDEVKYILNDIIEDTIIETTFEFQKGVDSLEGHIFKNITN